MRKRANGARLWSFLVTAAIVAGAAPTHAASQTRATPAALELLAGDGQFKFGASRDKATHVLQLAIAPRLPAGQKIFPRPGDLAGSGRVFPGNQIVVGRKLSTNRRMLKLVVTLDPRGVKPGTYEGQLPLFVGGGVNKQIPLKATLSSRVNSELWTFVLAFGAILLGASVGGTLKWLTEKGIKLQDLQRAFDRATVHLKDLRLPAGLQRRLASIEMSLAALDVTDAEAGLNQIVPKLDEYAEVASFFRDLRDEIDRQEASLPGRTAGPRERALRPIWEHENRRLSGLVDDAWPDPSKTKDQRTAFRHYVAVFTQFVGMFDRLKADARCWRAITDLRGDKTELAEQLIASVGDRRARAAAQHVLPTADLPEQVVAAALGWGSMPAAAAAAAPKPAAPNWWRRRSAAVRRWFVRNAGFVYGAILAVSVSLVGLVLLYFPKDAFGGPIDWLTLILWGFGVQLTGFTIAQLGGRALGAGPRLAP